MRVRWEAIDDETALLRVPFDADTQTLVVRFNPNTGLIDSMEAMRYREAGADKPKILWITRSEQVPSSRKGKVIASGSAMWLDQGSPWAYFHIESAIYNADVTNYLHEKGK